MERGYNNIRVETDSMMAVNLISKGDLIFWDGGSLVIYVLDLAKLCDSCQFQHVGRRANSLVHALTKWEGFVESDHVWDGSLPLYVT